MPTAVYPRLFPLIIAHSRISLPVLAYISLILPVPSLLLLPLHSLFIPSSFSLHSLFIPSSFPLHSLFIPSSFPLHSLFIPSSFPLHSLFILSSFPLHSFFIPSSFSLHSLFIPSSFSSIPAYPCFSSPIPNLPLLPTRFLLTAYACQEVVDFKVSLRESLLFNQQNGTG